MVRLAFLVAIGIGGFAPSVAALEYASLFDAVAIGGMPQGFGLGDVNADGHPDIVVAIASKPGEPDSLMRVYLNDGKGGFAPKSDVKVATGPVSVALGDFDADGKVDLAVACAAAEVLTLLRGNGDGSFAGRQDLPIGVRPIGVLAADLNGDGGVEILTVNAGTGKQRPGGLEAIASGDTAWTDSSGVVIVGFERGASAGTKRGAKPAKGGFRLQPRRVLTGTAQPAAIAVGDLNADGRADVVAATRGAGFVVWRGKASGAFEPASELHATEGIAQDVAIADLGGDGKADLVGLLAAGQQAGVANDRFGLAVSPGGVDAPRVTWFDAPPASRFRFADLDGDGTLDAVVMSRGRMTILPGKPDGSFGTPRAYAADVAIGFEIARLDADGAADLVALNPRGLGLLFLAGNGDGTFGNVPALPVGLSPAAIACADLNGDGKSDLATANNASADVSVLLARADGSFAPAVRLEASEGPSTIHAVDVTNDRAPDLVVMCTRARASQILLYRNRGDGTFHPKTSLASGTDPSTLVVLDANEDGKPDLGVPRANQQEILLYLGKGDGSFEAPRRMPTTHLPTLCTTGDLNGDGHIDLAICDPRASNLTLLLGKGDATFAPAPPIKPRWEPSALALADASGDGKADLILVPRRGLGTGAVLTGNGDGTFGARLDFTVTSAAGAPTFVDVDGDGRLDLLTADGFTGCLSVLRGAAAGGFEPGIDVGSGPDPTAIATLDYDGDGKLDLAAPSRGGNVVVLHRNLAPR